jgi:hypothetical protein
MTRSEFQKYWGFSDDEMAKIEACIKVFNGTILRIYDKPKDTADCSDRD